MSEEHNLQEIYRLNKLIEEMERERKTFLKDIKILLGKTYIEREEIAKHIEKHLTS